MGMADGTTIAVMTVLAIVALGVGLIVAHALGWL